MSTMTVAAVLSMIATQHCVAPPLAPIVTGIALHESGLDPYAVHRNPNGSVDVGIAQINSSNFVWLGLTVDTALDPCRNLAAAAKVLFVKYNGSPPPVVAAAYAADVSANIDKVAGSESPAPPSQTNPMPLRDALHSRDNGGLTDLLAGHHPQKPAPFTPQPDKDKHDQAH